MREFGGVNVRQFIVRRFNTTDAEDLATLFHASVHQIGIRHYSAEQTAVWSPKKPDAERYSRMALRSLALLVAEDAHGTVHGYGNVEQDGHIDHLYCDPTGVGYGIGSKLYAALEEEARAFGITRLFVEASEGALAFFEKHGFRMHARNEVLLAGVMLHNYTMSKTLASSN